MKNRSVMQHRFGQLPDVKVARSVFNRSHGWKGTFNVADLVPVLVDEVLPGDTFNLDMTAVCRLTSPLNRPMMDNLVMDFFFFFVPYRLVWDNFQKFMGEQVDPGDSIDYTIPQMTIPGGGITEGSLGDYFGLPIGVASMALPNSLAFRSYNLIYNEWFRDENLQDSLVVDKDDGPDTLSDYVLKKRCRRYDYFNQALPWPQKGDAVEVPLGTSAPVWGTGKAMLLWNGTTAYGLHTDGSKDLTGDTSAKAVAVGTSITPTGTIAADEAIGLYDGSGAFNSEVYADLSTATAATVNEWREAFQLQRLLERDARSGTRYIEWVEAHFGVTSPDARLQRPEYLGGGSMPLNVSVVAQTSESGTTKQGYLAGFVSGQRTGVGFTASFVEHGTVIGLVNVRADLNYQQRLDRMWTRQTREDLYIPVLANLGEQELLTQELFCDGSATDDDVFGYVPRWDEYRFKTSSIHGALRSDASTPLDMYHLAIDFGGTAPVLNASYIEDDPPIDRIQAVTSEDDFVMDAYLSYKCVRAMPVMSIPGMIDHF